MRLDTDALAPNEAEWRAAGAPSPLEVSRYSHPEDGTFWEVLWHNSLFDGHTGCSTPIASFSAWEEAIAFAQIAARLTPLHYIGRDSVLMPWQPPIDWKEGRDDDRHHLR